MHEFRTAIESLAVVQNRQCETLERLKREAVYWHFPGYLGLGKNGWRTTPAGAVRMGEWKLQEFFEDGRLELYNLAKDVGEKNNLARAMPEKVKELHAKLKAWRAEIKALMPQVRKKDKS